MSTPTRQALPSAKGSVHRRREQFATRLGLSVADLTHVRQTEAAASTSLHGLTQKERAEKAAARLGITAPELKLLRAALNDLTAPVDERLAAVIRTVLSGGTTEQTVAQKPTKVKPEAKQSGTKKPPTPSKKTNPAVYVTAWGQAVHLFYDCQNIRGFREVQEADPDVFRVQTNDAFCRGRKVCGTCKRHSGVEADRARSALVRFHGSPFTEAQWRDESWHRVLPKGPPIRRG